MATKRKKNDEQLILALACGATVAAAAKQVRLSERTVYKRLNDSDFRKRLTQARSDMLERAAGALTAASTEAVRTLLELQKQGVSATVRLGAARAILEIGIKVREIVDLSARICELEDRLDEADSHPD